MNNAVVEKEAIRLWYAPGTSQTQWLGFLLQVYWRSFYRLWVSFSAVYFFVFALSVEVFDTLILLWVKKSIIDGYAFATSQHLVYLMIS